MLLCLWRVPVSDNHRPAEIRWMPTASLILMSMQQLVENSGNGTGRICQVHPSKYHQMSTRALRNETWGTAPAGASAKARLGSAKRRD